jgi:hypothetical protein
MSTERIEQTERTAHGSWFTFGDEASPFAEWKRFIYRHEDGEYFVPAGRFGNEAQVVLDAVLADVPLMRYCLYVYMYFYWALRKYPNSPRIEIFDIWIRVLDRREKASVQEEQSIPWLGP